MRILITGASGTIGRFLTARLAKEGHRMIALGRKPVDDIASGFSRYDLSDVAPGLPVADALIHCALHHEPGKFRGGEGQDPDLFRKLNVEGTTALFQAAKTAGCRRAVFLSSRAVYGDARRGETLVETDEPAPDSLYGQVKLDGERALEELADARFSGVALRVTGVYGVPPGTSEHKWSGVFEAFRTGEDIEPRCATEVHGDDLADAVSRVLQMDGNRFDVFNVSDLLLDRRDLLKLLSQHTGRQSNLPERATPVPGVMDTSRLRQHGWQPGGLDRLMTFIDACRTMD
ncbi:NAD(P)-dependent oxidoreductase [Roseibium sp. MMSF_3412]|uniref:NAD-dependent epimerase/dehydratase family protein n=1 Tax=Roseibium sp. MMSF_3412 TaxID=3046712 RepID=UPI00273D9B27|nr:SDR family oxidoreductase [Roseibium sp. MMSF_3412]